MSNEIILDERKLRILVGIVRRESYEEMAKACQVGISQVQAWIGQLVTDGYVNKPEKKKMARSHTLTERGTTALRQYGVHALTVPANQIGQGN